MPVFNSGTIQGVKWCDAFHQHCAPARDWEMCWKNAQFFWPAEETESGPLWVCQHEGYSSSNFRLKKRNLHTNINSTVVPDASGLKEVDQVRESQEKVVHALQDYTVSHYPDMPSKFGELLLRMPELQRVCQVPWTPILFSLKLRYFQVGKEMLCLNQQPKGENESPGFNFLMELLRGDHWVQKSFKVRLIKRNKKRRKMEGKWFFEKS